MSSNLGAARGEVHACPASARRLSWVLAAALVAAAAILAARMDPAGRVRSSALMKGLLVAAAAVLGARIALSLAELRLTVRVRERDVLLELRGRMASLAWEDILRLDWDPPFRHYARWSPALVLVDRRGRRFRIPALVTGGKRLVADLLEAAGRSDLAEWAAAQSLAARMARSRWWAVAGYVVAACTVAAAALAPLR
jgi:hypothetical protein